MTVRHRVAVAALLAIITGCAGVTAPAATPSEWTPLYRCNIDLAEAEGTERTYTGFYEAEFESSSFKLSGLPCEVWLAGNVCPIFPDRDCHKGAEVAAYVAIEGKVSPVGNYGHFGMWERRLEVTQVLDVQRVNRHRQP